MCRTRNTKRMCPRMSRVVVTSGAMSRRALPVHDGRCAGAGHVDRDGLYRAVMCYCAIMETKMYNCVSN